MKILIVDDQKKHRRAGLEQLSALGHEVVVHSEYSDALEQVVKGEQFDVALLDLLMPAEATTLGTNGMEHFGKPIAVGYPLAVKLATLGVRYVGIATDANHHDHPASAMMDWFRDTSFRINTSMVKFSHAKLDADGANDWSVLLNALLAED